MSHICKRNFFLKKRGYLIMKRLLLSKRKKKGLSFSLSLSLFINKATFSL